MLSRLLVPFSVFLLFLALSTPANAQVSYYAGPTFSQYSLEYGNSTYYKNGGAGITGGGFYNFPIDSRLTAGIDGRGSYSPGSRGGAYVLGAVRFGFVPHQNPLRPYLQIGGGVVTSNPGVPAFGRNGRATGGALELTFGLDVRLSEKFDIRAFELGAAAGPTSSTSPRPGVGFITVGVVYHPHIR